MKNIVPTTLPSITSAVSINFIFANYEKKVVLSTTLECTGSELKELLMKNWPEGR